MNGVGRIQRDILRIIKDGPKTGVVVTAGYAAEELSEYYDLKQVERALEALVRRGFLVKEGIRHRIPYDVRKD